MSNQHPDQGAPVPPDFRALCAKVIQYNEGQGKYNFSQLNALNRDDAAFDAWQEIRSEIKHALAQPVPSRPTDEDLIQTASDAGLCYPVCWDLADPENQMQMQYLRNFALAVLARWGNTTPQPVPPAAGEVAELVKALAEAALLNEAMCHKIVNWQCTTLACLQRGGYVRGAGIPLDYSRATCPELKRAIDLRRAADLLERLNTPQPLPIPGDNQQ